MPEPLTLAACHARIRELADAHRDDQTTIRQLQLDLQCARLERDQAAAFGPKHSSDLPDGAMVTGRVEVVMYLDGDGDEQCNVLTDDGAGQTIVPWKALGLLAQAQVMVGAPTCRLTLEDGS